MQGIAHERAFVERIEALLGQMSPWAECESASQQLLECAWSQIKVIKVLHLHCQEIDKQKEHERQKFVADSRTQHEQDKLLRILQQLCEQQANHVAEEMPAGRMPSSVGLAESTAARWQAYFSALQVDVVAPINSGAGPRHIVNPLMVYTDDHQAPLLIQLTRRDGGLLANVNMRVLLIQRGEQPVNPEYSLRQRDGRPGVQILCHLRPAADIADRANVELFVQLEGEGDVAMSDEPCTPSGIKALDFQIAVEPCDRYTFGCEAAQTRITSPPFAIKARRSEEDLVVPYKGVSSQLGDTLDSARGCTVAEWCASCHLVACVRPGGVTAARAHKGGALSPSLPAWPVAGKRPVPTSSSSGNAPKRRLH